MSLEDLDIPTLERINKTLKQIILKKKIEEIKTEKLRLKQSDLVDNFKCRQALCKDGKCFDSLAINGNILMNIFREVMDQFSCSCSMTNDICDNCDRRGYTFKMRLKNKENTICHIHIYRKNTITSGWTPSGFHITFHKKILNNAGKSKALSNDIVHITNFQKCKFCINCTSGIPILQRPTDFDPLYSDDVPENVQYLFFLFLDMYQHIQSEQQKHLVMYKSGIKREKYSETEDIEENISNSQRSKKVHTNDQVKKETKNIDNSDKDFIKCFKFESFEQIKEIYKKVIDKIGCKCEEGVSVKQKKKICSVCENNGLQFDLTRIFNKEKITIDHSEIMAVLNVSYKMYNQWIKSYYYILFIKNGPDIFFKHHSIIYSRFRCDKEKVRVFGEQKNLTFNDIRTRFEIYKFYVAMMKEVKKL